jgi:hypothetical protein
MLKRRQISWSENETMLGDRAIDSAFRLGESSSHHAGSVKRVPSWPIATNAAKAPRPDIPGVVVSLLLYHSHLECHRGLRLGEWQAKSPCFGQRPASTDQRSFETRNSTRVSCSAEIGIICLIPRFWKASFQGGKMLDLELIKKPDYALSSAPQGMAQNRNIRLFLRV